MSLDKKIKQLLKKESGQILLKKYSRDNTWEFFLSNSNTWASLIYFFTRKKYDYILLTQQRIVLIIRNKVLDEHRFNEIISLFYNGINESIQIEESDQIISFHVEKMKITYEEAKEIRKKLQAFSDQL